MCTGAGVHSGGAGCHLPDHLLHSPPRQRLLPQEAAQARSVPLSPLCKLLRMLKQ